MMPSTNLAVIILYYQNSTSIEELYNTKAKLLDIAYSKNKIILEIFYYKKDQTDKTKTEESIIKFMNFAKDVNPIIITNIEKNEEFADTLTNYSMEIIII